MSNIEIALVLYGIIFGYVFRGLVDYIAHSRQDIPKLLEALDEADKHTCNELAKQARFYDNGIKITLTERDKYKARVEALERAIKEYAPCLTCVRESGNAETCGNCEYWLEGPGVDGWQFDEARFRKGEGENE